MGKEQQSHFFVPTEGKRKSNTNDSEKVLTEDETINALRQVHKRRAERVDLKEEEEDRIVGSVIWQFYWNYFRAALPVSGIVSLAVFFAFIQGKKQMK